MRRLLVAWAAWLGGLPLLAQVPAPAALPLAERVAAFAALAAAERRPATCRELANELARATMAETARRELLDQLQRVAAAFDADTQALVAMVAANNAFRLQDHDRAIANAEVAAAAPGRIPAGVWARTAARKWLFQQALGTGDVARAYRCLARYAEVVDPVTAGLAEADLLLRIGMVRALAVVLDRIEAAPASEEQRQRIACLRLQELLSYELFEAARAEASRLLAAGRLTQSLAEQVQLTEAFALARLGDGTAAAARLRALLGSPGLSPEYATLARAELAMLRLQRGEPLAAVEAELGPDLEAAPGTLRDWSLAARARLELQRGGSGTTAAGLAEVHDALQQRHAFLLQQWRATPVWSDGVAFLQWSVRRELLVCLCACELALGGVDAASRCLGYLLEADACGSLARRLGAAAGDPATLLQRILPPAGLLVWFVPAPRGSLALLADAGSVRAVPLPGDVPLRALVRELRQAVRDESVLGAGWREALAARTAPLAAWAFPPPLRDAVAATRHLTIVGRELLTGLPFEFLPSPSDPNRYLGHTHALDYVPSAALVTTAPPSPTDPRPARLAVLAATSQSAESAARYPGCAVPLGQERLAALAAAVDPRAVDVGLDLTRAGLDAALAQADALLLLAHGRRRHPDDATDEVQRQRPLGIVLGDGFYGAESLLAPQRVPPLVVLASCGTARAGVDRGEDGQLFGTAWLAAGATAVLSAEGDLELRATERLLAAFLAALVEGVAPAEALRRARVAVAAAPGFDHPAYHCALRLDVRSRAAVPLPAAPASRAGWAWLGLGVLAAGAAVRLRRTAARER